MKKKSVKFSTIIVIFMLILSQSCNKQEAHSTIISKSEIENPFNFIGEMHNAGLDVVLGALHNTKSTEISIEEIEKLTNNFCEKVFSIDKRFFVSPITKLALPDTYETEEVIISDEVSTYLDNIIAVASTDDYEYINEQFSIFETDILLNKSKTFSEYENALILCTLAVGKYSNEYWKESTAVKTKGLLGSIIAGDAIGAIKGMSRNAILIVICSVGGPGSLLAAAGRCALGPAIAGSVEAGIIYGASQL